MIPMIVWKLIKILQKFPRIWSQLGRWLEVSIESDPPSFDRFALEVGLNMDEKKNTIDSFFQGKTGFHDIMKAHWKLKYRSSSFLFPACGRQACQAQLNLSLSLSHLRPLTILY